MPDDNQPPETNIIEFSTKKSIYDVPQSLPTPVQFLTVQQLLTMPESTWLIEHLIPDTACGQLYGQSQSYKSFIALHMALCISTGMPFFDHETRKGQVLMMVGERIIDLPKRLLGWQHHYGIDVENNDDILFTKGCFDFCNTAKTKQFTSYMKWLKDHYNFQPDLIIIDTLSKAFGRNENSTEDMGLFLHNLDTVKSLINTTILLIHHTGHADTRRGRGSSRLPDDLDFCLFCERTEKFHTTLSVTKQKDADCLENLNITLFPVTAERGETLVATPFQPTFSPADMLDLQPDTQQRKALELLDDIICECGEDQILVKDFRNACCEAGICDRHNWSRTLKRLEQARLVKVEGKRVSLLYNP